MTRRGYEAATGWMTDCVHDHDLTSHVSLSRLVCQTNTLPYGPRDRSPRLQRAQPGRHGRRPYVRFWAGEGAVHHATGHRSLQSSQFLSWCKIIMPLLVLPRLDSNSLQSIQFTSPILLSLQLNCFFLWLLDLVSISSHPSSQPTLTESHLQTTATRPLTRSIQSNHRLTSLGPIPPSAYKHPSVSAYPLSTTAFNPVLQSDKPPP